MNVSLTQELEEFVNSKVQSGMYYSASEVIREGLRLLKEQDALREMRLQELRKEIAVGTEQADRGQFVDGEEAFQKLKAKSAERRRKKAQ
jgi:antitoxin ParD1/3/4